MNGIENNPASGEIFLENVILKVSQTHFSRISIPRGGHTFSKGGGGAMPPLGGAVKYPATAAMVPYLSDFSGSFCYSSINR